MIREIRGKGLMIGIEMKFEVRDILMGLIKQGVLMLYSGRNILRILPPLSNFRRRYNKSFTCS